MVMDRTTTGPRDPAAGARRAGADRRGRGRPQARGRADGGGRRARGRRRWKPGGRRRSEFEPLSAPRGRQKPARHDEGRGAGGTGRPVTRLRRDYRPPRGWLSDVGSGTTRAQAPIETARGTPWTRPPSAKSAPRTSTRATTGAARCRRSASWGSISRSASITAACTITGWRARAGAGEIRSRRAAGVRRQQHPLHHLDQDRRMGARQAFALGAADARRRSDPVGLRLGRRPPQALYAVAQAGELQGRPRRPARHRAIRLSG